MASDSVVMSVRVAYSGAVKADTKRLFIGFPVELGSSLHAALKRTKIDAHKREMEFQWIPVANLHVTLNFIGATDLARIPDVESAIELVTRETPVLRTSLRGLGAFPDDRHMRVLWVGVRKSRALAGLQERLRGSLVERGFRQEDRDYVPHMTVGRLRKSRAAGDLLSPYVRTSFTDIDVDSVVLFESLMHGGHVAYRPLSRFALRGTAEPLSESNS